MREREREGERERERERQRQRQRDRETERESTSVAFAKLILEALVVHTHPEHLQILVKHTKEKDTILSAAVDS